MVPGPANSAKGFGLHPGGSRNTDGSRAEQRRDLESCFRRMNSTGVEEGRLEQGGLLGSCRNCPEAGPGRLNQDQAVGRWPVALSLFICLQNTVTHHTSS